ncbi:MAG: sensor histidine kinase [Candidatus Heimdallarchaeota archaeon]|nr:sensor histidine kinase [Candidatus Heimdallarchaeota archaeon]MCK4770887.1 sensor histidine kinase [Candidatus Heimdallarchaeota archaeon]
MRKRIIFSIWIFLFITSIIPLTLTMIPNTRDVYVHALALVLPILGILIGIFTLLKVKDRERRDVTIIILVSISLLLGYEIVREFSSGPTEGLFFGNWVILWISAYFPFLLYGIRRIIRDYKFVTRAALIIGIGVTSITTVVVAPIMSYFFRSIGALGTSFDTRVFLVIMIVDFIAFFVLNLLLVLYVQQKYGYYWILFVIGFGIFIFRDLASAYSLMFETSYPESVINVLNMIFYSTMVVGFITLIDPDFDLRAIKDLDIERQFYKARYVELQSLSKDLITVTELWFHDLKNDMNVINNAKEFYDETEDSKYFTMIMNRINLIEERLMSFQSPSNILDSLKIQPMPIDIIEGVYKAYDNVTVKLPDSTIKVKANKLLFPIILNIVHNAFQHAGKEIDVSIEVFEGSEKVIIEIKDNGKGIPDEIKEKIFLKSFSLSEEESSGLGLYLARLTINSYGGRITVSDNEPIGTIFKLELQKIVTTKKN